MDEKSSDSVTNTNVLNSHEKVSPCDGQIDITKDVSFDNVSIINANELQTADTTVATIESEQAAETADRRKNKCVCLELQKKIILDKVEMDLLREENMKLISTISHLKQLVSKNKTNQMMSKTTKILKFLTKDMEQHLPMVLSKLTYLLSSTTKTKNLQKLENIFPILQRNLLTRACK